KPSNLMLTSSGVVKVLDLGLARLVHPTPKEEISQAGEILGTLEYMAPERLRDGRQADSQGDVYSLGCTLYKLLTGHTPFSGGKYDTAANKILAIIQDPLPPPETFRPDLPQGLIDLIGRMLAKDRATRPATPGEVAIAIRPFAVGADLARLYERARTASPRPDSAAASQSAEPAADVAQKAGLHPTARRAQRGPILGRWWALLAVTGTLAAAVLAVVISLRTRQGTLVLTVDQPGAQIRIDDQQVEVQWEADGMKVVIPAGAHTLQVAKDGFEPFREPFEIRRGGRVVLSVTLVPQARASVERCLQRHNGAVMGVAFSPDGRQALTGGKDGMVHLWDVETGAFVRSFRGHTDAVRTVAFSPDAKMLVTGGEDGTLRLWDTAEAREIRKLEGHQGQVTCAVFSPDGTQVLSGSFDMSVRLWEVASGRLVHTLTGNRSWVRSVAISPDGRWGLSGGNDVFVRLWDLKQGRLERVLQGHRTVVGTVAFGPDSRLAIGAGWDHTIRVWDIDQGRQLRVLDGGQGGNRHVALIPHTTWAIAGGSGNPLQIWDLQTGQRLQRLEGHTSGVCIVAVSADGRYAISGSEDHTARLWPLPKPAEPVELRVENMKATAPAKDDEGSREDP
ncbi:MAG: PEGA domain-containing protein, partial [Planctomycetes bacterium]|nr:PEGA domain-containing protein [Planctomycetota bacterium]